jgi:hypothetical protein
MEKGTEPNSFREWDAAGEDVRRALHGLRRPVVPGELTARLRVIASHERQRRLVHASISSFARNCYEQFRLAFDLMMKPAAPFAGGTMSAVALFGMLAASLSFPHRMIADASLFTYPDGTVVVMGSAGAYVPASLPDMPRIVGLGNAATFDEGAANVVELTIDEKGRVCDFTVARGQLTMDIENIIMFSEFTPATILGTPTAAKVTVVQRPPARRTLRS